MKDRKFIVEFHDIFASVRYIRHGRLKVGGWWRSLKGEREVAWLSSDDWLPALAVFFRVLLRCVGRAGAVFGWIRIGSEPQTDPASRMADAEFGERLNVGSAAGGPGPR